MWRGTGGAGCTGGRRRGGGKREKKGKITQHCAILRNLNKCKEAGANKYRAGTGIKGYGKRVVYTPFPSPPLMAIQASPMVIVLVGGPCGPSLFSLATAE